MLFYFLCRCSHLIIEHGTKRKYELSPSHHNSSKKKRTSVLGSVSGDMEAGFSLGGPATDKDGKQFHKFICIIYLILFKDILKGFCKLHVDKIHGNLYHLYISVLYMKSLDCFICSACTAT